MKILFADDDPVTLEALETCARAEGYEPILARNGQQALELWERHTPDLLCLDIMMPEVDGYEVCRRIRSRDASVPVLFLSAKSEEWDVVLGLRLGADDFIRKPFGKSELLARILAALRRGTRGTTGAPSGGTSASFEMGGWTIYTRELRAVRGPASVDLSPREIAILGVLHRHRGEVVGRDQLLNECWGLEYYPESRTLDQHLMKLRRKLGEDPASPLILETVRGAGYRYPR